ncbi:MAG: response regulator [Desulfobacteraceae bacterium]|nr:response regulator [Desulfobacteraceae bacterium]
MKKKILVIDDDINIRDYLVSIFKDNGYKVIIAGNVKEGLSQTKKNTPDLITLDIEMPGEWGPRFYQQLSQDPELKNIPIIVISGLPGHECAVVKAVASFPKPFDREELLKTIKETLN